MCMHFITNDHQRIKLKKKKRYQTLFYSSDSILSIIHLLEKASLLEWKERTRQKQCTQTEK